MSNDEKTTPATVWLAETANELYGEMVSVIGSSGLSPIEVFEVDPASVGIGGVNAPTKATIWAAENTKVPPPTHSNMPARALALHRRQIGLRTRQ